MLIYVAANRPDAPWPDLVLVGTAIHEGDEGAVRAAIGGGAPNIEVLRVLLSTGSLKAILAIARDPEFVGVAPQSRCFMGLYFRLRVLQEMGLRQPKSGPSLFFRVPLEMVNEAQAGLQAAAGRYGEQKAVFVAPDSPESAGRVARELASLIGASYATRSLLPEIAQRVNGSDKPSGWVHYTLRPDCPCPGCGARRLVAAPPPRQLTGLRPPRYGVRLERAGLPPNIVGSLRAAGIRTLTQVDLRRDSELMRIRNVGPSEVALLRETVDKYRPQPSTEAPTHD
jgi:hypothetical protein